MLVFCSEKRKAELMKEYLSNNGISPHRLQSYRAAPAHNLCHIGWRAVRRHGISRLEARRDNGRAATASFTRISGRKKGSGSKRRLQSFTDLSKGDLVVHENHGIGRFVGMFKLPVDGVEKDYIKIAYAGTDSLYVPATQLDMVSKYIGAGGEDAPVRLSKLGGAEWSRAKSRAKTAAKELAQGLIQLYAERSRRPGHAFSSDTVWQQEFESSFEYTETEDQLRAISEIKTDMEKPAPMDRLLCGDVGFGKTEVAFRAVMKCVMDGKQAAILVPTRF